MVLAEKGEGAQDLEKLKTGEKVKIEFLAAFIGMISGAGVGSPPSQDCIFLVPRCIKLYIYSAELPLIWFPPHRMVDSKKKRMRMSFFSHSNFAVLSVFLPSGIATFILRLLFEPFDLDREFNEISLISKTRSS